jgi:hypothetical protein
MPFDTETISRLPFSDTVTGAEVSASWPADGAEVVHTGFTQGAMLETLDIHVATWKAVLSPEFIRGDCNGNGSLEGVTDAVFLLDHLFLGGGRPPCAAACDPNGDGSLDLSDAVYVLVFAFIGGSKPVPPYPECGPGEEPADKDLGCDEPSCL